VAKNDLKGAQAFCIGKTTASEAKKYTDRVLIAAEPTLEALVNQAISAHNPVNS
jgi:uroporphyrinogen-III synthase